MDRISGKHFWELSHYLLWCIGIAHGDISINNLMYDVVTRKGIVNDFDLAALMEPGDISPQKKGWERTGTKPFMALELLDNADGSVKRRYRHDLESFAWCLLWCGMNESFPDKTINGSTRDVFDSKRSLAFDLLKKTSAKPSFKEIWQCIVDWVQTWVMRFNLSMPGNALRLMFPISVPKDDREFVREFAKILHRYELPIPLDDPQLKWIDFQVPLQAPSSSKDRDVIVSYTS
ncbi:uncharacterized protein EV420DRAFT_1477369 [Desarmillaria tabescens]|uniref:Fungal-type protein kinase domain-containing protein n=1 Tax=Armillaria tabescens TaxID=1929756 RepID=A0AA39N9M5_ARMTA|nr:uncharacterized protein EV420DRAFT_1477369 [Desarmillaria tabescens]KAK0461605.1 hypothetical protein EV420DRAFT_1477369 [Desarmillaria tabescens]